MPRYIDADKFIAHLKDELKECEIPLGSRANGKGIAYGTALGLKSAISFADTLSTADVVPKSESEKLVQDSTRLVQENETLKDNNEHLAVMLEEAKAEVGKMQNELVIWKQNRFNLFQRLECYEMARQKVASEIFAEIETLLALNILVGDVFTGKYFDADLENDISEFKKKYTEGEDKPAATEEKYFSPEDVRKMTNQEVREKYTAIRRSMERW